jgi:hypothetical protein
MQLAIQKTPGVRNDLVVRIRREELEKVCFHIANRAEFMRLPGLLRGPQNQDEAERRSVNRLKRPLEEHLRELSEDRDPLMDTEGVPQRCMIAIGSRNVGNNRGFQAWQREFEPHHFRIRDDRESSRAVPMLTYEKAGGLSARDLLLKDGTVLENEKDVAHLIDWCVVANCVLRHGRPVPIEEIADEFYDIGHLIAADREKEKQIWQDLYDGFSLRSRQTIVRVMRDRALPRNRYLHSALGLSDSEVVILQREGTPEEIAGWLQESGATDGFILDNGGSVFCWVWWLGARGGYIYQAPDFRPPSSAVVLFVLYGVPYTTLPGGSISYTVI